MAKFDAYVICTSPRSGSTLLIKLLAATGVAGEPKSYFHFTSITEWQEDLGLTADASKPERDILAEIFRTAITKGSSGTGIFGLRLQRHSFDFFMRKLAVLHPGFSTDVERVEAAFGKTLFIHLTRTDKFEQAVSYVKAEQSGLWHVAPDGSELERLSPPASPVYNSDEIRICYDRFVNSDRDWNSWFKTQGIEPLRITYDALSSAPNEGLRDTLDRLGLDANAAKGVVPGVAKLADKTNQEWVGRFRNLMDQKS
ncbi:MAG: Stf0 family sulfotransferase [Roseibium sp.]